MTTKKKAKAVTLRDRVESLEYDRISLMAATSSMKQRLTALEQRAAELEDNEAVMGKRITGLDLQMGRIGAPMQAPDPEEVALMRAVVEAALAWQLRCTFDTEHALSAAAQVLRAYRAKKRSTEGRYAALPPWDGPRAADGTPLAKPA